MTDVFNMFNLEMPGLTYIKYQDVENGGDAGDGGGGGGDGGGGGANDSVGDPTDTIYRKEFLSFFKLTYYNDEEIMMKIDTLFTYLNKIDSFNELFRNAQKGALYQQLMTTTLDSSSVIVLLGYDTFHLFYDCLISYKNNKTIVIQPLLAVLNK